MAGKISELAPITGAALALTDFIEALDVSDLSMAPTGTNKQLSLAETINFLYANGFDARYVNESDFNALGDARYVNIDGDTMTGMLRLMDFRIDDNDGGAGYLRSYVYDDTAYVEAGNLDVISLSSLAATGIQLHVFGQERLQAAGADAVALTIENSTQNPWLQFRKYNNWTGTAEIARIQASSTEMVYDNATATAIHKFRTAAVDRLTISNTAVTSTVPIALPADPTASLEAATKQYVDNLVRGLAWKDACRVATTANITTSGLQTIDGVTVVNGDRVLVKNQSAAATNGILIASTGAWARSFDADSSSEIEGMACFVAEGTTQADTAWVCTANAPITTGSTALPFVQFAGTGGSVPPNRLINTTAPLTGGGDLSVDRTIALTAAGVTNAYLATMPTHTFKGNNTAGTAAPLDLTISQMQTELAVPALPVTVANGGSGRNTATTAYGLIAAGTTPTGAEQTVAPAASGFLKTTSTTALPAWTAIAQADVTNLVNDLSNKQPLDSDLSAIAALAHVANSMIQSNGSAWIAATPTQVKTGLAITKTDVGLGNVDNTSDANKLISTATQTALDAKQPLDTDLTTIAGLAQASGSILQSNGTAWTAATPAQAKTALALDQVNNTSDANKPVSTAQNNALALRVLKAGDTMTGPLLVNNPSDGTMLSFGWNVARSRYELLHDPARALAIGPYTTGELEFSPTTTTLWTSKPLGINSYEDVTLSSDNKAVKVWADDFIDISLNYTTENIMLTPTLLKLVSPDIQLAPTNLVTSTKPIALPADPASPLHAATKQYVDGLASQATLDARYVNTAGDTMTGQLLFGNQVGQTINLYGTQFGIGVQTNTIYMRSPSAWAWHYNGTHSDTSLDPGAGGTMLMRLNNTDLLLVRPITLPGDPSSALHAATKQYVDGLAAQATLDARYVNTSGDTMTGVLNIHHDLARMELKSAAGVGRAIFGSDAAGPYITAVVGGIDMIVDSESKLNVADAVITSTVPIALPADPASPLHAATKAYVDAAAGGGGGGDPTWTGTQAEFDALVTVDSDTHYYVTP